jgi:molybdate transport system ATP-binding protein
MAAIPEGIRVALSLDRKDFRLTVDLRLPGQGVTGLFGHSGSGKTTLLRAIAGLERRGRGFVAVKGEVWQDDERSLFLPAHRRSLGYVFQEANLFPHLTLRQNLEYGYQRVAVESRRIPFDQAISLLGLESLLSRRPDQVSGGERQRAAMARALLTSPGLLLMDEPLSALDIPRKKEILPYLERLHRELEIPVLYVSHSPDEVARLCDHLVVLEDGRVLADGPLQETIARLDLPMGSAEDAGVVVDTVIAGHDGGDYLTRLAFTGGSLLVPARREPVGSPVRCRIHARDVSLALSRPVDTSILNIIAARVVEVGETQSPAHVMVRLDVSGVPLLARITRRSSEGLGVRPSLRVWAQIKSVALLE